MTTATRTGPRSATHRCSPVTRSPPSRSGSCISNIHLPDGLDYRAAARTLAHLITQALGVTGIGLTDEVPAYVLFIGIHLYGAGDALKLLFAVTASAAVALVVFAVG